MARAYITEKQVGREFWYYAILHAVLMINQVPGRLGRKLTSPFELVHGVKPDSRTWFELFSTAPLPAPKSKTTPSTASPSAATRRQTPSSSTTPSRGPTTAFEDHSLDGIAVGRDAKTNTIIFYNPVTRSYYRPQAFRLDEGRLPVTNFPKSIKYDGGLTCGLLRNRTDPVPEPFPPGTRVLLQNVEGGADDTAKGTIQSVPLLTSSLVATSADDGTSPTSYVVHMDDGTTREVDYADLLGRASADGVPSPPTSDPFKSLPHFLQRGSKLTMDFDGAFHKGYLEHSSEGGFRFDVRRNARSKKVD
ncbi:hypothetical protein ACHAWF_000973, partial [Thalassiosira exigua]